MPSDRTNCLRRARINEWVEKALTYQVVRNPRGHFS